MPTEAIKNFDEERAINFISTTFQDHSIACVNSYVPTFYPINKIVELYEALVKSDKEKVEMLQKLLSERNYNCYPLLNSVLLCHTTEPLVSGGYVWDMFSIA